MAGSKKKTKKSTQGRLPQIHRSAAGIDVGSKFHVAAIPPDRSAPVQSFESFTGELHRLADWLKQEGITTVAMESTGVYWIPVFEILEERGFEVLLVNARDVKNVPGRKTDINDAQWIQQLHEHGLLRASFRPRQELAGLRAFLRHRDRLVEYSASHVQHMQKALMQMNLQLHHVLSDITGLTGMKIIRSIIAGERDPKVLAKLRDPRCKASPETIQGALTGNFRPEHVFALQQALELHDVYQAKIRACDERIEQVLNALNAAAAPPSQPLSTRRSQRQGNEPRFDVRSLLHTLTGVDLTEVHGLGPYTVLKLIGECGDDMSRWRTAKHFTSWLTLSPGNKISGGKILSSKTRRSSNRAAVLLRLCAVNVGKTRTALGAFYRRLAARVGKAKAVTATARKIAVLFYNMLRHGTRYSDPGADYYEERYKSRVLANLKKRAESMGYQLIEDLPTAPCVS